MKTEPLNLLDIMFVRHAFDRKNDAVSAATSISFVGEISMTQQEFRDECDVNNIMARYEQAGVTPMDMLAEVRASARFGDCTLYEDYHNSMNFVAAAGEAFDALPAKIRARFDNDPEKMLRFLDDKENTDEAIRLGLLPRPQADEGEAPAAPIAKPDAEPSTTASAVVKSPS